MDRFKERSESIYAGMRCVNVSLKSKVKKLNRKKERAKYELNVKTVETIIKEKRLQII